MFNDTMSKCSSQTSQGCRFKLAICTACHKVNQSPFFINCSSINEPGLKMFLKPTEDKCKTFINTRNGTILTLYIISMVSCYLCSHLKTILYKGINIHTHTPWYVCMLACMCECMCKAIHKANIKIAYLMIKTILMQFYEYI